VVLGNKEEILKLVGISKNLDISKKTRTIERETIGIVWNILLNCQDIGKVVIMNFLASFVLSRSEGRIGFGLVNAAASQCILNA
jgi:hypothetical protein